MCIFINVPIGAVKILIFNFFDEENKWSSLSRCATLFNTSIKPKKIYRLVAGKMKDERGGVFWLMIVVSIKNQNVLPKNVVTISHNEYKNVLFNRKYLRHSINKIQSENHRIRACEINKISFSYFDDEMRSLNNGYDGSIPSY